jgi:hypothetical protein
MFLEILQYQKKANPIVEHAYGEYEVNEAIEAAECPHELSIDIVYVPLIYQH